MSRLHPSNWPTGTGTVLFFAWLAFAIAITVWLQPLLWTVLPVGLTLYLIAAWYPLRVVLLLVAPLTLITGFSRVVATSPDIPIWVAYAAYLIACGYFSVIVSSDNLDRLVARLPSWLLGEGFEARLAWGRFEQTLVAVNAVVRQPMGEDRVARQTAIHGLATEARREARRGGIWQEAWTAQVAWLAALEELVGTEAAGDRSGPINDLLEDMDRAHMAAIERTTVVDPVRR